VPGHEGGVGMKSSELMGKEVVDAAAKVVGPVKGFEIDIKKWTVTGIIVKSGFLKKTTVLVGDIEKIGDKVMLKVPIDKVQKA
jgi:sporulation protein YlmC with PRC-barrel domain